MVLATENGGGHRRLALPVELHEDRPEPIEGSLRGRRRHGCTAVDDVLERREDDVGGRGVREHDDLRRHHPGVGDSVLVDQGEHAGRVEARGRRDDLVGGAGGGRDGVEPRSVTEGRGVQRHVGFVERREVGQPRHRHEMQDRVRQHRSLRMSRGARRVEDPGDVAGVDVGLVGRGRTLEAVDADDTHRRGVPARAGCCPGGLLVRVVGENDRGAGVTDQERELVGGQARVARDEGGARPPCGEHGDEVLEAVVHEQRDARVASRADGPQPPVHRRRSTLELGVVDRRVPPRHRGSLREARGSMAKEAGEVHRR